MQEQTKKNSLSAGVQIGRYEIREILGIGGFGITYKAWDIQLSRLVAVKEYLPTETAVRAHDATTVHAHESRADEYTYGLQRFLGDAKTLAQFHHPNIIDVLDYLQANNTGYLVMSYEQGQTLSERLKKQTGKLVESELVNMTKAILQGLQHIHEFDYYHRDIKPGNIYIRKQGDPVLIDFGAARQAVGNRTRSLTNIVSAGYAPSEQYGSNQSKQGPWSDLYAVGATMYHCITGKEPADAPTRQNALFEQESDPLTPAIKVGHGLYSDKLLEVIDWMLAPAIQNRPQNVSQVLSILEQDMCGIQPENTDTPASIQENRSTMATFVVTEKGSQRQYEKVNKKQDDIAYYLESIHNIPILWPIITSVCILILVVINIGKNHPTPSVAELTLTQKETVDKAELQNTQIIKLSTGLQDPLKQETRRLEQIATQQARGAKQKSEQQLIESLLLEATDDIKQLRLTSPRGNNAFEKYQQVLQLDPNNQSVQNGYTLIVETYLYLAKNAQYKKEYDRATRLINKARRVQSGNPKIYQAKKQLQIAQTEKEIQPVKQKKQWKPMGDISDFFKTIFSP